MSIQHITKLRVYGAISLPNVHFFQSESKILLRISYQKYVRGYFCEVKTKKDIFNGQKSAKSVKIYKPIRIFPRI